MSLELEEKLTGARIVKQIWRLEICNIVLSFFYRMWFSNFVISTSMIIIRESLKIAYGYRVIATSNSPTSNVKIRARTILSYNSISQLASFSSVTAKADVIAIDHRRLIEQMP
uniref:Uncharacterized protein n=1 Tax=Oryza sativa subsp. japonica TaxID=39947 RepID=Q60E42_ORYSJ|nr:hypothetical protein [Oryza sativa Japonica Group]